MNWKSVAKYAGTGLGEGPGSSLPLPPPSIFLGLFFLCEKYNLGMDGHTFPCQSPLLIGTRNDPLSLDHHPSLSGK